MSPKDIFGREAKVGDTIAAGMGYNRSSVIRVGEIVAIKEKNRGFNSHYGQDMYEWWISVKWTHDGNHDRSSVGYGGKITTSIKVDSYYSYSKFVILPTGWTEQFPPDIKTDLTPPRR